MKNFPIALLGLMISLSFFTCQSIPNIIESKSIADSIALRKQWLVGKWKYDLEAMDKEANRVTDQILNYSKSKNKRFKPNFEIREQLLQILIKGGHRHATTFKEIEFTKDNKVNVHSEGNKRQGTVDLQYSSHMDTLFYLAQKILGNRRAFSGQYAFTAILSFKWKSFIPLCFGYFFSFQA
ncbi:hypothetical protein BWI93_24980 [Siphonobacter sp. BAB-5385]|uniref:hypothetical protein n=1 Tax=Siphonobacter sp. BAB-5385 TaxID=1864822 RepID=UPI000B9DEE82|nr:hypothetical protein [Siphonobacter sp. BAB-5385]OZI05522.1 hypothetical protein BWI93_24980 [Siphonobacter sp. BAB-5385]